jgi:hypothetical protein
LAELQRWGMFKGPMTARPLIRAFWGIFERCEDEVVDSRNGRTPAVG